MRSALKKWLRPVVEKSDVTRMKEAHRVAPELPVRLSWLSSEPQSLRQHRGAPVVLFFWSRGCAAGLELLGQAQKWLARYEDRGLRVIGVHAPEYEFERDLPALEALLLGHGYTVPIAADNEGEAMAYYENHWRPRLYVINGRGEIVHNETERISYALAEEAMRDVLRQAGAKGVSGPLFEAPLQSRFERALLGYAGGSVANRGEVYRGVEHVYRTPGRGLHPQLIGAWRVEADHVVSAGGQIVLPYAGSQVYVTLDMRRATRPARVSAQRGYFSRGQAGNDVHFSQELSLLVPDGARLYHVISHAEVQEGRLRLDMPEGARVYSYTVAQ